jgi:hypothetical protein
MDPVSNLGAMIESVRRQLGTNRAGNAAPSSRTASTAAQRETGAAQASLSGLQQALRQRLAAIDGDETTRRRRATRVFVEQVLLREFGDAIIEDPAFQTLLDQVQGLISADPELDRQLAAALKAVSAAPG